MSWALSLPLNQNYTRPKKKCFVFPERDSNPYLLGRTIRIHMPETKRVDEVYMNKRDYFSGSPIFFHSSVSFWSTTQLPFGLL